LHAKQCLDNQDSRLGLSLADGECINKRVTERGRVRERATKTGCTQFNQNSLGSTPASTRRERPSTTDPSKKRKRNNLQTKENHQKDTWSSNKNKGSNKPFTHYGCLTQKAGCVKWRCSREDGGSSTGKMTSSQEFRPRARRITTGQQRKQR
jgi:hypothetical protein